MTHAAYILHIWKVCKANPGVQIGHRDIERLIKAELADWTDHGNLTTDQMVARLRRFTEARITAGQPLRYVARTQGA